MPYAQLKIPPGLKANGTDRQSKGFWRASNLARDYGEAVGPVLGWRNKSVSGATITGSARAMLPWRDSTGGRRIAVGTHSGAYSISASGVVTDITPSGFTSGRASATTTGGFGRGPFGRGAFGTPRPDTGSIAPATVWDLDLWNQDLLGCSEDDGDIYTWDRDTANNFTAVTNAPTGAVGIVVSEDPFLFALFERSVQWSDQGNNTVWTPSATNQAGDKEIQTAGTIRCGRKVRGATLIHTDVDLWAATFRPGVFVFDVLKVADGCGVVSKGSPIALDSRCFWMGFGSFWQYNGGAVSPLQCNVQEELFSNLNEQQISKVWALHNAKHSEIWWFYPSKSSTEIDKAVSWNYLTGAWWMHDLARTCGHGASGIFSQPLMLTTANVLKEHEVGTEWDDATPYVRSGPLEIGAGDRVMHIDEVIGDENALGDTSIVFHNADFPNAAETATNVLALSSRPAFPRFASRQTEVEIRFGEDVSARCGDIRLGIKQGGRR